MQQHTTTPKNKTMPVLKSWRSPYQRFATNQGPMLFSPIQYCTILIVFSLSGVYKKQFADPNGVILNNRWKASCGIFHSDVGKKSSHLPLWILFLFKYSDLDFSMVIPMHLSTNLHRMVRANIVWVTCTLWNLKCFSFFSD